jgi:hypothetical protein
MDCPSPSIRHQYAKNTALPIVPDLLPSHQGTLSYCMYLKSGDSMGIVESHARDFEDTFNLC